MKIKLKKDYVTSFKTYPKGTQMEVTKDLGEQLVNDGIAVSTEFVSLTEKAVEKVSKEKAKHLRDELPTTAKDQVTFIKSCNNQVLLQELTGSTYKSVRTASLKRLEEI